MEKPWNLWEGRGEVTFFCVTRIKWTRRWLRSIIYLIFLSLVKSHHILVLHISQDAESSRFIPIGYLRKSWYFVPTINREKAGRHVELALFVISHLSLPYVFYFDTSLSLPHVVKCRHRIKIPQRAILFSVLLVFMWDLPKFSLFPTFFTKDFISQFASMCSFHLMTNFNHMNK